MKGMKALVPEFGAMIDGAGSSAEALDKVRAASAGMADEFAGSSQGKLDIMKIKMGEMKESIGAALMPAFEAIMPVLSSAADWLGTHLPGAIEKLRGWFEEHWPAIKAAVIPVIDAIRGGIKGFITFATDAWKKWGDEIMAVVNAVWPAMKAIIGGVIDAIRGVIKVVTDLIRGDWEGVWNGIKQFFSGVWEAIKGVVTFAIDAVKIAVRLGWDAVKGIFSTVWEGIKSVVSSAINLVVGYVTGIPGRISSTISTMWEGIKSGITGAKDWVRDRINDVVGFATGLPGRIAGAFSGMWDGIKNAFKAALNWIIEKWNGLEFKVPSISVPFFGEIGGFTVGLPDIPKFHTGGVAQFGAAGEGLALLRNNEVVFTPEQLDVLGTSSGPSASVIVNVYVSGSVVTQQELTRAVYDGLVDGQRRGEFSVGLL
jgi:phage-related protein